MRMHGSSYQARSRCVKEQMAHAHGSASSLPQGPRNPLQTRVLFHCAHKMSDETKLMSYHQQLTEQIEDQLSLASIHYQRR